MITEVTHDKKESKKMKKAVIYARYSSERQTEQSIEGQLTVCHKFAKDNGFVVIGEYVDRAMTGTNDHRPAFRQMIEDSSGKEWQYVIVYKGDRFSRNRIESAIHKKTLRDNGVKLVSATENIPDTPEGIILESLLEGMAEYYSAELSQKVKRGMAETRKKGYFTGGRLLIGYELVDRKPVPSPIESQIVLEIHKRYVAGQTGRQIESEFAEEGVTDKHGNPITAKTIYRILRQQSYTTSDVYPAIVPADIKDKVNAIIEDNKRSPARRKSYSDYLLSGKLICGECGGYMTGEAGTSRTGEVHHYYKCFEKKRHTRDCTMPSIRKDKIENEVFDICCEVLKNGYITRIIDKAYKIHLSDVESNATVISLESKLEEKEKALSNLLKAIEEGLYTSTTKQRLLELEQEVESTRTHLNRELAKATNIPSKEDYQSYIDKLLTHQSDNQSFKKEVFDILIRNVVIFRDKIRITFNFMPDKLSGERRDYARDLSDYTEACSEYAAGLSGSKYHPEGQPKELEMQKSLWFLLFLFLRARCSSEKGFEPHILTLHGDALR